MSDLSILNVGAGDTKLTFNKEDPKELERTRRIVVDMLKLGYAILVKVGETTSGKPKYRRAVAFDATKDEYVVMDVPKEPSLRAGRRAAGTRVPASGARAVGVSRSAGGMSTAVDSIEMQAVERFDSHAVLRNNIAKLASAKDEWAGLPMPLQDAELIVDPKHPAYAAYPRSPVRPMTLGVDIDPAFVGYALRSTFYSFIKRCNVYLCILPTGKVQAVFDAQPSHHIDLDLHTMGASVAWGVGQEAKAVQLLATLLPHHAFKMYLLTGMFLETSLRSHVTYVFRRLRPTLATAPDVEGTGMRILCALCQHPIAYYAGTWAGAMCPTDDVIAHLMLMRGDEHMYWRRSNQHPAYRPEAGL